MHAYIVMPCLNEERYLARSCATLGFGETRSAPVDTTLVMVDNASTDRTKEVAASIAASAPPGCVVVLEEPERGYVPPRQRGIEFAADDAQARGRGFDEVLIVQADADVEYGDLYVHHLRAALQPHQNLIACAIVQWDEAVAKGFPHYVQLANEIDDGMSALFAPSDLDVVLTDAACAYRLKDYIHWGGHQREHNRNGEEIHSETTRLYMRAQVYEATRCIVEASTCMPSGRRVLRSPLAFFASAGFPREASWWQLWEPSSMPLTPADLDATRWQEARQERVLHVLALFLLLPLHVSATLAGQPVPHELSPLLPPRTRAALEQQPGVLIQDVITTMTGHRNTLLAFADARAHGANPGAKRGR